MGVHPLRGCEVVRVPCALDSGLSGISKGARAAAFCSRRETMGTNGKGDMPSFVAWCDFSAIAAREKTRENDVIYGDRFGHSGFIYLPPSVIISG